ncbi:hypothetical protein HPP92_023924 [Vanilla planifolia]|uniref:Uncharacterized protein n=1 Tax=Vanilla planifolia TaxID=51239 RepID=A0A835PR19_VANPL|nr:hypothetical protein HPP92_023924 [Vanilla planifolia]
MSLRRIRFCAKLSPRAPWSDRGRRRCSQEPLVDRSMPLMPGRNWEAMRNDGVFDSGGEWSNPPCRETDVCGARSMDLQSCSISPEQGSCTCPRCGSRPEQATHG